jgi:branched-chain amino acid aminotransferase
LHYGSGVFEGIRCYDTPKGPAVFRLTDHMRRLEHSAKLIYMRLPYTVGELVEATHELLGANGLPACYIRPIAFYGYGTLGVPPRQNPVYVAIMSWPWSTYLGQEALEHGVRAKISTWRRVGANTIPHAAKATGVYLNSMLAVMEANRGGYEEAILLTEDGYVGDGSGETLFAVKDGVLSTPDLSASILQGITRASVVRIAQDLGYEVREKPLIRTDLYLADELFMTGTAAEVTPIRSVDDVEIGEPGPVTKAIQETYLKAVTGGVERYAEWLEHVPKLAPVR